MPTNPKQNPEAKRGSTASSESAPKATKPTWFQVRIAELEDRLKNQAELEQTIAKLTAEGEAKDRAIGARLEGLTAEIETLSGIGWGLAWAEYWRRTKQYDMLAPHALRSKSDQHGNRWSVQPLPIIPDNASPEQIAHFASLGDALGYDAFNPPTDDAYLVHCQPDRGMYEIACDDIEKAQKAHLKAQSALATATAAKESAISRNRQDLVPALNTEIDAQQQALREAAKKFNECKAVIENAIQRYYIIWLEDFARFSEYAMPLKTHKATVMPQKRHQNLPVYEGPKEAVVPPQHG